MAQLDARGHELLDSEPLAVPLQFRQRSYFDQVREFIKRELSGQSRDNGQETFEEADDFDVGDDYDPSSPWELSADQEYFREDRQKQQTQAKVGDLSTGAAPQGQLPVDKSGSPTGIAGKAPSTD